MFIHLTLPASQSVPERPVSVNPLMLRVVTPRWIRKGPDFVEEGTFLTIGVGDDCDIAVTESYGVVTGAIADALRN